ncbi:MAG: ATPase, partial [Candidatus Eisenbacteria bacterium]
MKRSRKNVKTMPPASSVVVAGDITIDWNIARLQERLSGAPLVWNAHDTARACPQPGGAELLADAITEVGRRITGVPKPVIHRAKSDVAAIRSGDPAFHHSYALWSPHPLKAGDKGKSQVWRVESYLGMDVMPEKGSRKHLKLKGDPGDAVLYALDDAALGFRDHPEFWPEALKGKTCPGWILVKTASPVALGEGEGQGRPPVWQQLVKRCPQRLIVLMTADDLRHTEVQVSRELSWERLAQDLLWALTYNSRLHGLSQCAHVIVSLGTAGALWLHREGSKGAAGKASCTLIYDPLYFEGQWNAQYPGGMIGYMTCLAAGVAQQVLITPQAPDILAGIRSGVMAMRALHERGFGNAERDSSSGQPKEWPTFPHERVADALNTSGTLPCVEVPNPQAGANLPFWSILDACPSVSGSPAAEGATAAAGCSPSADRPDLRKRAESIVLDGLDTALRLIPRVEFGKLKTADRHEIEGYRSIRGLLAEYCASASNKPVSIAVFGPPGSGKSFGVKQVAASIGGNIKKIEFNLSQFDDALELIEALHQVRDVGLQGNIPLVFWDEFDSRLGEEDYGWLRYFLAPMQDGVFQDGQITHHVGKAIFVFAGGTCHCMADFVRKSQDEHLRGAKMTDFVSRLKGYYDALGPDPLFPQGDPQHIIRRAVLLRSLLSMGVPHLFDDGKGRGKLQIDPGVLRAFLLVREYRHGVRSMESIIAMSILADRTRFERSSLPCRAQLDIHVDATEFLSLVQQPDFTKDLDKLAEAFHDVYCRSQAGKKAAPPHAKRKYADLPKDIQAENRANVLDIGRKLAAHGYVMLPA